MAAHEIAQVAPDASRDPASAAGSPAVAVFGGGPAGLMAAETAAVGGSAVTLYDHMPSLGRKFLMAGRGGLNLTHSEPFGRFSDRYGAARERLLPALRALTPDDLRDWAAGLGEATVVGSSGRVFPASWKASPLLRAWLRRLAGHGVAIRLRHRWRGFSAEGGHVVEGPDGLDRTVRPGAAILAFGGASWPRLGSDGAWQPALACAGIPLAPLRPANCGLHLAWSDRFRERHAGVPLKRIALSFEGATVRGDGVVTRTGLEGGAVYPLSAALRDGLARTGAATLRVDLRPDLDEAALAARLARPRGRQSASTFLRKRGGLAAVATALLHEACGAALPQDAAALARLVKAVPLAITGTAGLDRAISSAGGVAWRALDERFMLRERPGTFVAGEMIDWDAPTGGYLLQASIATGAAAARGALAWRPR